ncbi:MAG: aromatic ring-hydroxylating dioxygenase subunit alpha [Planctomycetales bacterium]|nr:aromatic ring-hydroxylating dioxygenase subunit alpha [Planctomycetales bacterium]
MEKVRIDPDIRRAATLPARVYRDPEAFALQRERLFPRAWHLVGDAALLREPGDRMPVTLLPGALDEPLLLARGKDGRVRLLSNVCTHRGNVLVTEPGRGQDIRCRYHGRRFGLDGKFLSMPEFAEAVGFPSRSDDLPEVPLGEWGRFLLGSLAPEVAAEKLLEPIRARAGFVPLEKLAFDPKGARDYEVAANWALYLDNYLEGFHIPYVHASLNEALDYAAYATELSEWGVVQVGVAAAGEPAFDLPAGHPDVGKRIGAYYFWLFPTTMFNVYPWGISVNVVQPLAHDRTRVSFLPYVLDPLKRGVGAGSGLDRVEREDEQVVESVQRGVRSRLYDRGRYSPTRETGVHHFHRLLVRGMGMEG